MKTFFVTLGLISLILLPIGALSGSGNDLCIAIRDKVITYTNLDMLDKALMGSQVYNNMGCPPVSEL